MPATSSFAMTSSSHRIIYPLPTAMGLSIVKFYGLFGDIGENKDGDFKHSLEFEKIISVQP